MEYSERQLDLLKGKVPPSTSDETEWLDRHSSDIIPEERLSPSGEQPSIDNLPPVNRPLTGKRPEVLPGRPENSSYPGTEPPRPMPLAGVPRGDRD